jgi:hypothetical protein
VKIMTEFVYPSIPIRDFDWIAVDDDTYDGANGCMCAVGHGASEEAAIADLKRQIEEQA